MLSLSDRIGLLKGVGEQRQKLYSSLGVTTIGSLLTLYPRDYLDLSQSVSISDAVLNENNVIKAIVCKKSGEQRIRKGLSIFKIFVTDGLNNMVITIFNARFQYEQLNENEEYLFYGKVTGNLLKREMSSPQFFKADSTALVNPIYPLTDGITNKMIQNHVREALRIWGDCLDDCLTSEIKHKNKLCQYRYAIENIHFPKDLKALSIARERLIFEELFVLQLGIQLLKQQNRVNTDIHINADSLNMSELYDALPFTLTAGQKAAVNDGLADLCRNVPMNRLIQGDVGSGKTMVAAALCFAMAKSGFQAALMAPTQILAEQHYNTLSKLLSPLGIECCLITGSQKAAERKLISGNIQSGLYKIIVGTHALIQDSVVFDKLGLVVTDEQHRFGVAQRARLISKGNNPHLLVMSATPIPRTLALIIYGDLDISVISELPKGRKPVETFVIDSSKRARSLGFVKKQLDEGRQAYIVCPLIEETENAASNDLISVSQYIEALRASPLSSYKIGGLNGKLKANQKEEIMSAFKNHQLDILVSTTVIEVGVDVPNANIMVIENAERFGLSQLHQLRGRVGRGIHQSYCVLISDHQSDDTKARLKIMKETTDGFKIAEEDLKLRGPGDFFGSKQHGLPALKIASLVNDMQVLSSAADLSREILLADPALSKAEHKLLKSKVDLLFTQANQHTMN